MNSSPEKLNGLSLDIADENRARLKALFPAVFTETLNEKGKLVDAEDFEKLKANAVQTFATLNIGREKAKRIVFRTV